MCTFSKCSHLQPGQSKVTMCAMQAQAVHTLHTPKKALALYISRIYPLSLWNILSSKSVLIKLEPWAIPDNLY